MVMLDFICCCIRDLEICRDREMPYLNYFFVPKPYSGYNWFFSNYKSYVENNPKCTRAMGKFLFFVSHSENLIPENYEKIVALYKDFYRDYEAAYGD